MEPNVATLLLEEYEFTDTGVDALEKGEVLGLESPEVEELGDDVVDELENSDAETLADVNVDELGDAELADAELGRPVLLPPTAGGDDEL